MVMAPLLRGLHHVLESETCNNSPHRVVLAVEERLHRSGPQFGVLAVEEGERFVVRKPGIREEDECATQCRERNVLAILDNDLTTGHREGVVLTASNRNEATVGNKGANIAEPYVQDLRNFR